MLDFEKLSSIAKENKLLFIVDNHARNAHPLPSRRARAPNIVIHIQASKYIDGHAAALGGMIVDIANFDYKGNPRYPDLQPCPTRAITASCTRTRKSPSAPSAARR